MNGTPERTDALEALQGLKMRADFALTLAQQAYKQLWNGQDAQAAYHLGYALEMLISMRDGTLFDNERLGYDVPQRDEALVEPALARFAAAGLVFDERLAEHKYPESFPPELVAALESMRA